VPDHGQAPRRRGYRGAVALTVGTAGHIDHGKTRLVRALTGKDTDRLPEEQERGISIALGYAPLELDDGTRLSLIDVPGHERFVRTMVAGATGIDLFLLVIDAGEGARPQTHEHLAILRLLGIERGVVAVTKTDAVDAEALELALAEARELVPGAEVVAVSAKTGEGLGELRAALARAAAEAPARTREAPTRLYVDRAFTIAGAGTVVTGTLWSGSISPGDELRVEPPGLRTRARGVQVHDLPVTRAEAGRRVAVNLPGIARSQLRRGDALVAPGSYPVSWRLDVALEELEPVPAAVTVHVGTSDVAARVVREGRYAQLRLREPVVAARGDRIVLRTETTVGGGVVLDPAPARHFDPRKLEVLEQGDPEAILRTIVHEPVMGAELQARGLLPPGELAQGLAALAQAGDWYFAAEWLEQQRAAVRDRLVERARSSPLDPGIPLGELLPPEPWAPSVLQLLRVERRDGKAYAPGAKPQLGEHEAAAEELEARLEGEDLVRVEDRRLATFLEQRGTLKRVGDGFAVSSALYDRGVEALNELAPITIASFRDALGISRRTAQLLLERFDADGITRRVGDERRLRAAGRR
jgi:selenocysteine-specific elongation factor